MIFSCNNLKNSKSCDRAVVVGGLDFDNFLFNKLLEAMATLIEAVKRQALLTFAKNRSSVYFEENLSKLRLLASKLTSSDVELDKSLLLRDVPNSNPKSSWTPKSRLAPVTYIEVFENPDITIGIFILRNGARLPLHDHPLMYGILKVIHGKVRIHSYSPLSKKDLTDEQASETRFVDKCGKDYSSHDGEVSPMELFIRQVSLFATKEPEVVVDQSDDACLLSPRRGNLHEIHTVDGPAAFVDILSPPYDTDIPGVGPRPCRYFREVSHPDDNLVKKLIRIPSPSDYWSDTAPYTGPSCNSTDD